MGKLHATAVAMAIFALSMVPGANAGTETITEGNGPPQEYRYAPPPPRPVYYAPPPPVVVYPVPRFYYGPRVGVYPHRVFVHRSHWHRF